MKYSLLIIFALTAAALTGFGYLRFKVISHNQYPRQNFPVFLESPYNKPNVYDGAFKKYGDISKTKVLAAITSHHFLAKDLIAQSYAGINAGEIKTVLIISPDHYNQILNLNTLAVTTGADWNSTFGILNPDRNIIQRLVSANQNIGIDTNLFRTEHGIYIQIPFIKKKFPQALVVPMVLRQSGKYARFFEMGSFISRQVDPRQTILIMSSDFSHNISSGAARLADTKSAKLLMSKNSENISGINNDCRQCTAFLFGYLKRIKTEFRLIFNKNSFDISGKDPDSVTSYIGAYYLPK